MTAPAGVDGPGAGSGSGRGRRLRTLTGVLPVVVALVVIALGALLVSPAFRHTVGETFTRQDEHYVELFFTDEKTARSCPVTSDGDVAVRAALTSHLAGKQDIDWTIVVRPDSGTTQQATGTLDTRPDRTTVFGTALPSPSGPYTVLVTLGSRSERLLLHC